MARNNAKLDAIYDVFEKHGVTLNRDAIWEVQGTPVVKHKDVERLGAAIKIKWDVPTIIRAERDEAVILVVGHIGEQTEWSIGEALINGNGVGGNYKVSGKQASYVYAIAEKRAKDRVILKLAQLHGDVYSEEEADDFKDNRRGGSSRADDDRPTAANDDGGEEDPDARYKRCEKAIDDCKTIADVTNLMKSKAMLADMGNMHKDDAKDIRSYAEKRLKDLGWGKKQESNG